MMPVVVVAVRVKTRLSHRQDTTMTMLPVVVGVKTTLSHRRDTMVMMMPVVVVVGVKTTLPHHNDTTRGGLDCDVCPRLHLDHGDPPLRPFILKPLYR
eukprot:scaffold43955_cov50-Attheya_sp.AAC.2